MEIEPPTPASPGGGALFIRIAPLLFVLIWSTGWIVARFAAEYAEPLTFLLVRYSLAIAILLPFALVAKAPWPSTKAEAFHALVAGILLHGLYLGGVWWAIAHGVPASISALLAVIQPILTAALAPSLVGEKLGPARRLGIGLGCVGLVIVLAPNLAQVAPGAIGAALLPLAVNVVAMISVTCGTFYQRRFVHSGDLRTVTLLQYCGALAVTLPVALATESLHITWNATTFAALAWSVLALSIGAIALLLMLIRRGEVYRSAQLLYLVPPAAALQAYFLFDERLTLMQWAGMGVTVVGVTLARRK